MIWISVSFVVAGALWITLRLPQLDPNSLSTYNGIGTVKIEGVIDADPDVRDTYINLRVSTDRLARPSAPCSPSKVLSLFVHRAPPNFITAIACA